jgi:putative ABC transport system permease protein
VHSRIIGRFRGNVTQRWASAAGGAIGGSLALALLVCGCVFLALTGPALSLRLRTNAMQQELATQAGPLRDDLTGTANWIQFADDWMRAPLTEQQFDTSVSDVGTGISKVVPVAPGTWGGLTTSLYNAPPGFAGLQFATHLEVMYRTSLAAYTRVAAGTLSAAAVPAGDLAVSVTTQTAARFRLHPGSVVRLAEGNGGGTVSVYVTGIVRPLRLGASFWSTDVLAAGPVFQPPLKAPGNWQGGLFADPGQFLAMENAFCPDPGGVVCDSMTLRWDVPFSLGAFSADQAQALANDLNAATSGTTISNVLGGAAADITVTGSVTSALGTFIDTQAAVLGVLLLLLVSLIAIGLAVIALAARLIAAQRADELRMLRARGATAGQLARRVLAGSALAVIPASLAGVLLALIPIRLAGASLGTGWRLALVPPLAALIGPPLLAAWQHRKPQPSAVNPAVILTAETRAARYSPAAKRRIVAGVTVCAAAVAVLLILHDEGLPAPGSVNWVLTVAPVLVAIPAALVAMRLYPLVVRLVLRTWHRVTAAGYVALASSTRPPAALSAYTLVLALTLAAFCGMVSGGISRGQVTASWQATSGADVTISPNSTDEITPAVERRLAAVPGVRHSTAVSSTTWSLPGGSAQITLVGVSPAQYAALAADTPASPVPAAALTGTGPVIPIVASPAAATLLGHGVTALSGQQGASGNIRVRVAGTAADIPAQPAGSQFGIIAESYLGSLVPGPDLILITGNVSPAALTAVVSRVLPGATVTFRASVLSSLTGAPLVHAGAVLMTLSVLACSVLALLSLLLGLALDARDREQTMARLAVMGDQRGTRFALLQTLPALLAAAVAAVACTLALPTLVGAALDLSPFITGGVTGSTTPVQFGPDLLALCAPGAAIVILAWITLIVQTRRSRRDLSGRLRAG